jgi:DNA-binding FadR family transcriptional regulator
MRYWVIIGSGQRAMTKSTIRDRANAGASAAFDFIDRQIAEGHWKSGEQLPTERELVERFGIARNTVRKTLRRLEGQGKITRQVGQGTFVANLEVGTTNITQDDQLGDKIRRASPAEIMDFRLVIEPQAGMLAATYATAGDLKAIKECLHSCDLARDVGEFQDWDGRLHQRIVMSAGNRLLSDIYEAINKARRTAEWGKLKERSLTSERRVLYQEQHRRIVNALGERDPELARTEIREHLLCVRANLGGI